MADEETTHEDVPEDDQPEATEPEAAEPEATEPDVTEPEPAAAGVHHMGRSEVDAMGKSKRREVIGHSYGPTRARQLAVFGIFFACVAVLFIGGSKLVSKLDEPPKSNPAKAPWAQPGTPQTPSVRPM